MSNKEFETKVLSALEWLTNDVSWLKEDVSWLKGDIVRLDKKMDSWFDRLENIINNQTNELKETIDMNWKYINQAFDIITTMQNDKSKGKKQHFA